MITITEIKNISEWESIKAGSINNYELIVLKYSPICTVSFTAGKILESWSSRLDESVKLKIVKINVIESRPVSNKIADETQIRHESPQLIWYDNLGNVKWDGSHFRISEVNLKKNLSTNLYTSSI